MQAKQTGRGPTPRGRSKPTRAERRAMQREEPCAPEAGSGNANARFMMVVSAVALAVILGVGVLAVVRSQQSSPASATAPTATPMVVASAYNPGDHLLRVGSTAPNFVLRDTTGDIYQLSEERGRPVLLEFFAVWCPHCQHETPIIHRIEQNYMGKGVDVWAVVASPFGAAYEVSRGRDISLVDRSDLAWYRKQFGVNYPILVDPRFGTVNKYLSGAYPGIYIIDQKGKVAYARAGETSYSVLAGKLNAVLAHKSTS
jgi:thiol-disulfide isomerase/thioredoxin